MAQKTVLEESLITIAADTMTTCSLNDRMYKQFCYNVFIHWDISPDRRCNRFREEGVIQLIFSPEKIYWEEVEIMNKESIESLAFFIKMMMFVLRRRCPCCGCGFDAISGKTQTNKQKKAEYIYFLKLLYFMSLSLLKLRQFTHHHCFSLSQSLYWRQWCCCK